MSAYRPVRRRTKIAALEWLESHSGGAAYSTSAPRAQRVLVFIPYDRGGSIHFYGSTIEIAVEKVEREFYKRNRAWHRDQKSAVTA